MCSYLFNIFLYGTVHTVCLDGVYLKWKDLKWNKLVISSVYQEYWNDEWKKYNGVGSSDRGDKSKNNSSVTEQSD